MPSTNDDIDARKLTLPVLAVIAIIIFIGSSIFTYAQRERGIHEEIIEICAKVKNIEEKGARRESEIATCKTDMRNNDRTITRMDAKLEYLVDKVNEISDDIKRNKKEK